MTISLALLVPSAVVAAGVSVVFFFRALLDSARSDFHYKLWAIHDEIEWNLLTEQLSPDIPDVRRLLKSVAVELRHTQVYTPFRMTLFSWITRNVEDEELPVSAYDTSLEQQQLLRCYQDRLTSARLRYLFTGSPSGWVALPLLAAAAAVKVVKKRTRLRAEMYRKAFDDFPAPSPSTMILAELRDVPSDERRLVKARA